MDVGAFSVSFIIEPLALVNIAIAVNQTSLAVGHVVAPVALVLGSVLPDLEATPMTKPVFGPLALVDSTVV